MKRLLETWKLWTTLSILLFFMTCGVFIVHATWGGSSTWHFTNTYKTGSINNILTDNDWNQLMGDLDKLLPEGAVMAFLTDNCPDGWSDFPAAEWRFLMWASSKIGSWWWSNSITLTGGQLPSHSHYIAVNKDATDSDRNLKDHSNATLMWAGYLGGYGNYYLKWTDTTANVWKTSWVWNWNPINITNPYIKVHYCVKWNTTIQGDSCEYGYSNINTLTCWQWYEIGDTRPSSMGGFTCGKCIKSSCPSGRFECNLSYSEMRNVGVPSNQFYAWEDTCVKYEQCCFRNANEYAESFWALPVGPTNPRFDYDYIESICR